MRNQLLKAAAALGLLGIVAVALAVVIIGPDRIGRVPDRLAEMAGINIGWQPPTQAAAPAAQVPAQPVYDASVATANGVHTVSFSLETPDGAAAYQIDTDPNFDAQAWVETTPGTVIRPTITTTNTGYQMIFARFRLNDGSVTAPTTVGVEVDPRPIGLGPNGGLVPEWVRTASPRHLVIKVSEGRIVRGGHELYDLDDRPDGDSLGRLDGTVTVERNGELYGFAVSDRRDVISRPDYLDGFTVNVERLGGLWLVSDGSQPFELRPVDIVTRPYGSGESIDGENVLPRSHEVVLELPTSVTPGHRLTITPPADSGLVDTVAFAANQADITTSRSIHVNQAGFAPGDRPKRAVISSWLDGIGDTEILALAGQPFTVIDAATGAQVSTGTIDQGPWSGRDRNELDRGDLTGAVAVGADFSDLAAEGVYRVCVDTLGCSEAFPVGQRLWHDMTVLTGRAAYHQRSGIELGPPYTSLRRPRPYHPDDGFTVVDNRYSLVEFNDSGYDFERLASGGLSTIDPVAWGGHFDAGDWDRRIMHLWYARTVAFLLHEFPELAQLEANIPESGDAIPDLLDEAMWTVDFYRRLQSPDGAISGGVEAAEHPPWQSASWLEDLEAYVFAPDPGSSYLYAAVAAETSVVLRNYDPTRADELLASAVAAMEWAEVTPAPITEGSDNDGDLTAERNGAAAGLLFATGDQRWHDIFVETADYIDNGGWAMSCQGHTQCDAAWLYLRSSEAATDPERRDLYRTQFLSSADEQLAAKEQSPFGWMVDNRSVPLIWGLGAGGAPHANGLIKAYLLSGDPKYREAVVGAVGASLGANPLNQVFSTGIGQNPVRHPLIIDVKHGDLPVWPGTPVFGPHESLNDDQAWVADWLLKPAGADPGPRQLPYLHRWFDVGNVAFYNEFTIHQSHAEALLAYGFLAGTAAGP